MNFDLKQNTEESSVKHVSIARQIQKNPVKVLQINSQDYSSIPSVDKARFFFLKMSQTPSSKAYKVDSTTSAYE